MDTSKLLAQLALAEQHAATLLASEQSAATHAMLEVQKATARLAAIARLAAKNNHALTVEDLYGRADWQIALTQGMDKALDSILDNIAAGQQAGWKTGSRHAKKEAKSSSLLNPNLSPSPPGSADIVEHELRMANATEWARESIHAAVTTVLSQDVGTPPEGTLNYAKWKGQAQSEAIASAIDKVRREYERRAGIAASAATSRAHTEAQIQAAQLAVETDSSLEICKIWITSFGPNTCGACAALHGRKIPWNQEFDESLTFSTRKSPAVLTDLQGPPRHPHCHCRIIVLPCKNDSGNFTSADLQSQAAAWAINTEGMAPTAWDTQKPAQVSEVAKTTDYMTAADFRSMPQSIWEKAEAGFKTCILKLKSIASKDK